MLFYLILYFSKIFYYTKLLIKCKATKDFILKNVTIRDNINNYTYIPLLLQQST